MCIAFFDSWSATNSVAKVYCTGPASCLQATALSCSLLRALPSFGYSWRSTSCVCNLVTSIHHVRLTAAP
jgi:hypothetical protein